MRKVLLVVFGLLMLTAGCAAQVAHKATLNWNVSADAATITVTYNVYRADGACPSSGSLVNATKIATAVTGTSYTDSTVTVGKSYCYSVRSSSGAVESIDSNLEGGVIPLLPVVLAPIEAK